MRLTALFLSLFLFIFAVRAQGGPDDPDDPDDPQGPDDPPDNDPPWRPTPTQRPTPIPSPTETEPPDDPPAPIFTGVDSFANATVYQPDDASHHLTSPRTVNLPNNTILAVWNDSAQTQGTLQVFQSTNNGFSWYTYGTAKSTVSGRRLLEPHLFFIDGSWGDDANLTLLAVNAVDAKSTNIELYASYDKGVTFDYVSRVAQGGPVGSKAVGAPHLIFHDNRLTVYYSDQRDNQHAQKVSQQSTADIYGSWDPAIDVVVSSTAADKAGIASVAKLPNNQYIIVFELNHTNNSSSSDNTVNFKITTSLENAGTESMRSITSTTGLKPQGAPFVTWSPLGGANGTLVVSDSTTNALFVNQALGEGMWRVIPTITARAYGREVHAVPDKRALRIIGGSEGISESADVMVTYMNLEQALGGTV